MRLLELISTYVGWAQRLIRPAPRDVTWIDGFWDDGAKSHQTEIEAHIGRITLGTDLNPFLSKKVLQHGYVPKGSDGRAPRGIDWNRMDLALNAWGVHHIHLREKAADELLFLTISRSSAVLLMLGSHKSFHNGEVEDAVTSWRSQTDRWTLRGVLPERGTTPASRTATARLGMTTTAPVGEKLVVSAMLSTAGTSMWAGIHADRMFNALLAFDPALDCSVLTSLISGKDLIRLKGRRWSWRADYCDLVLVEETTPAHFVALEGPT
jgi:hypothetical protein